MKELAFFALFCLLFCPKINSQVNCPTCPIRIHDEKSIDHKINILGAFNNDLGLPDQGVCEIILKMEHTWIGDARLELTSPAGKTVRFFGWQTDSQYTDSTTWDVKFVRCDDFAMPDFGFDSTFSSAYKWGIFQDWSGSYFPQEGCLDDFNDGPVNGTWLLTVADDYNNDIGQIFDFKINFCDPTGITSEGCDDLPTTQFSATIDGYTATFLNETPDSDVYSWDFNDGTSSLETSPTHVFPDTGWFNIGLAAFNGCGQFFINEAIYVPGAPPIPGFGWNQTVGCEPLGVHFSDSTSNNPTGWLWVTPGAVPDSSYSQSPTVTYYQPGVYPVELHVINAVGSNSLIFNELIQVLTLPTADFSIQINGNDVAFSPSAASATGWFWQFGDGSESTENAPTHSFAGPGDYFVGLVVKNECGDDFFGKWINVPPALATQNNGLAEKISLFPNPTGGDLELKMSGLSGGPTHCRLTNSLGQLVENEWIAPVNGEVSRRFDLQKQPAGLYFLSLESAGKTARLPVLKN